MHKYYRVHNKGDGRYYIYLWLDENTLKLAHKGYYWAQREICNAIRSKYGTERRIYWNVIKRGIKEIDPPPIRPAQSHKTTLSHCGKENCSYCDNGYYSRCPNN